MENNIQDPPSFKNGNQLKKDVKQSKEPNDESLATNPKSPVVNRDGVSNTCVDISTFTPVEFIIETFQFCTTDLKNVCEVTLLDHLHFPVKCWFRIIVNQLVLFLLFLAPAGGSNPARPFHNPFPNPA